MADPWSGAGKLKASKGKVAGGGAAAAPPSQQPAGGGSASFQSKVSGLTSLAAMTGEQLNSIGFAGLSGEVSRLTSGMTKDQVIQAARAFGIPGRISSAKEAKAMIEKRLHGTLRSWQAGQDILGKPF